MRKLGAKLSDEEIRLLVQEADVDGDGQVDINEVSDRSDYRLLITDILTATVPGIGAGTGSVPGYRIRVYQSS